MPSSINAKRDDMYTNIFLDNQLYTYYAAWDVLHNPPPSEDSAMDAFTYIVAHPNKVIGFAPYQTTAYLKRISFCRAINRLKKSQREKRYLYDPAEGSQILCDPLSTDDRVLRRFAKSAVKEGIRALPLIYRVILSMEVEDGHTLKEISNILKLKYPTAKKRAQRARSLLFNYLLSNYGDNYNNNKTDQKKVV